MFEALLERGRAAAERRARARSDALAQAMRAEAPRGVRIERSADGVAIFGRGIVRRFATEPGLRWLAASLLRRGEEK